jgi:hypothetical protein
LTPQLAQGQLLDGFKASDVRPEAVPSHWAQWLHKDFQGFP